VLIAHRQRFLAERVNELAAHPGQNPEEQPPIWKEFKTYVDNPSALILLYMFISGFRFRV
jgi:hypothetical protein